MRRIRVPSCCKVCFTDPKHYFGHTWFRAPYDAQLATPLLFVVLHRRPNRGGIKVPQRIKLKV
jgi:hypothetical protein